MGGELGIVTGRQNGVNIDGDAVRRLLQVNMLDETDVIKDVRTVEQVALSGDDTNPANGCRAFILEAADSYYICIAITDDLTPEVNPGEREIYSTDNPVTTKLAKLKLNSSGELELNGNTDYAVSWTDLNTALQLLVTNANAELVKIQAAIAALGGSYTPTPLVLDISAAKVLTVRLP